MASIFEISGSNFARASRKRTKSSFKSKLQLQPTLKTFPAASSLSVLFNLCEKFGVSIDYLLGCFSPFPDRFAERLKEVLRKREGKTLHEFAEVFDLDASTEKLLLSGKCFPSAKVLNNLCRYLNCSADYLIGLSDAMDQPTEFPISIGITAIPRQQDDPFADLDPDLRSKAEGYLDGLRDQQNARRQKTQSQEA